jgi:hypothetical protein
LNADIAQAQAISDFQAAKAAAAQATAGQPLPASADPVLVSAAAAQLRATAAQAEARQRFADARRQIGKVAMALYVGLPPSAPNVPAAGVPDRSVFLADILKGEQQQAKAASTALAEATAAINLSRSQADQLVQARTVELQVLALQAQGDAQRKAAQAAAAAAKAAAATASSVTATTAVRAAQITPAGSLLDQESPSVLGPSLLTAGELAEWYRSTGRQPHLTVALEDLAASYVAVGANAGVRADVAFAQSMVETGYFDFPAFGQVAVADNNFAGIGACDSCATGFHFPDAVTGVQAQMQLLHAYATTAQPVPGPLPGPFSVSGCCPTWLQLTGVWATSGTYGVAILKVYRTMVEWAVAQRRAAARL